MKKQYFKVAALCLLIPVLYACGKNSVRLNGFAEADITDELLLIYDMANKEKFSEAENKLESLSANDKLAVGSRIFVLISYSRIYEMQGKYEDALKKEKKVQEMGNAVPQWIGEEVNKTIERLEHNVMQADDIQPMDGKYIPIFKTLPRYPVAAIPYKTRGYVKLRFAISETGLVSDIEIVESGPGKIFDRSAVDAVKQFRYMPTIQNGKAVVTRDVINEMNFSID